MVQCENTPRAGFLGGEREEAVQAPTSSTVLPARLGTAIDASSSCSTASGFTPLVTTSSPQSIE
jgi:hypothetical protein